MRIAISGSHRTGKSTLVAELAQQLRGFATVAEPYHLMEEDGHEFSDPPSIEDFEAQLERSLEELREGRDDVVFDRCPLDFVAYTALHRDASLFELDDWLQPLREALDTLDLVVFVPIEAHERIVFRASRRDSEMRAGVDEHLRELLLDDPHEFGLSVVEVSGDVQTRVQTVVRAVARLRADNRQAQGV